MNHMEYLQLLENKYQRYFTISKNVEIVGENVELCAKYAETSGRTLITQNDVIDRCEKFEFCYAKTYDCIAEKELDGFISFVKKIVNETVRPGAEHMTTYITGVMISYKIDEKAKDIIKSFKYSKTFMFYLRGWCEVRLVCIDLQNGKVVTNKSGRAVENVYRFAP